MSNFEGNWTPPPPPGRDDDLAGFWIRFVAHLLDQISLLVIIIPLGLLGLTASSGAAAGLSIVSALAASWLLAKWTSERGGSPWRARFGVLVLDTRSGAFLSMDRAFRRAAFVNLLGVVTTYVPGLLALVLIDYLWMLWDPNKQTLHDKIAESKVVNRR
jgi:uncharacterized RDD family membrane protein YckC